MGAGCQELERKRQEPRKRGLAEATLGTGGGEPWVGKVSSHVAMTQRCRFVVL